MHELECPDKKGPKNKAYSDKLFAFYDEVVFTQTRLNKMQCSKGQLLLDSGRLFERKIVLELLEESDIYARQQAPMRKRER